MGSLVGHIIPGTFFIIYGWLSSLNFLWYHLKSKSSQKPSSDPRSKKEKSASSSFFEFKRDHDLSRKSWIPLTFTRLPIEPFLKILLPALGMIVEVFFDYRPDGDGNGRSRHLVVTVFSVWDSEGNLGNVSKLHHVTMYAGFLLSGMMDIITMCVRLPKQTSMLFLTLAFTVEGLLFYLHTLGRNALNVEIHGLLSYAILSCAVFSLLRLATPTNLAINLGLGSSILLQGTWFIHAGYILFGGFLDNAPVHNDVERSEHDSTKATHDDSVEHIYVMFVAACFAWHLILVALNDVVLWVVLSLCLRSRLLHSSRRGARRRGGFLAGLRQGWRGSALPEERSKLMVVEPDEEKEGAENGMEMRQVAETYT